jgi:hypothetical protein
MNASEKITVTGKLRIRIYDKDNNLLEDTTTKNMIVNLGLNNVCGLLTGDGTGYAIDQYKAGVSATAPALTDTTITGAFTKAITGYSYPGNGIVNFNFTMELAENNGMTIQEYGLVNANNRVCARVTRAPITKNNTIRLVGDWTIIYSN